MKSARDQILGRVRDAIGPSAPPLERATVGEDPRLAGDDLCDLFLRRLDEYGTRVVRTETSAAREAIRDICARAQTAVMAPADFPDDLRPQNIQLGTCTQESEMSQSDTVLTLCALAIGETGSIVTNGGPGQGERWLTLLPRTHICVVGSGQLVQTLPDAFARLKPSVLRDHSPLTFISGPSATTDIELTRVVGVHGPQELIVIFVDGETTS